MSLISARARARNIQKFYKMRAQLQTIALRIQTARSNETMMQSMKGATGLIKGMNRGMQMDVLAKIAQDFERENDIMEQKSEMAEEVMEDEGEAVEGDEILKEVLDEIGVELKGEVSLLCFAPLRCASSRPD